MDKIAKRLYIGSPAIGLLPFILFFLLTKVLYFKIALVVTLVLSLPIGYFYFKMIKHHIFNLMFFSTLVVMFFEIFLSLLPIEYYFRNYGPFFNEISMISVYLLILQNKKKIIKYIYKYLSIPVITDVKLEIYEFFYFLKISLWGVLIYTFIITVYLFFFKDIHSPDRHEFFINDLRTYFLSLIIIFGLIRTYLLSFKFKKEVWLPIIEENGKVTGKVAKSVSEEYNVKFLHPSVRLYIFYKGLMFLNHSLHNDNSVSRKFDTPLKSNILFDSDIDDTLSLLKDKAAIPSRFKPRFIFKHIFENVVSKKMIFVFVISLPSQKYFNNKMFSRGKLWTEQEIDNNIGKGVFSDCFEKEFPFLQSVVFPAEKLMNDV
ncbi:MAG: hypothetical protein Q4F97_10460 [Bacteroidales bacterium]|nr:hypothetical protein [Bacteroidales bacterium]